MSERLTDDFMADLETKLGAIENEYRPECIRSSYGNGCAGATDESVAFWRAAVDRIPAMLAELRERRAQDLTTDEVEALEWLVKHLRVTQMEGVPPRAAKRAALAVLDRLLSWVRK